MTNYQKNGTDLNTLYAKYSDTSVTQAITTKTTTVTNYKTNGTDLASTFVKYSDLAPNNMKGTQGSANGYTSSNYSGDLGTNFVVVGTVEYLLRVQLDSYDRTQNPVSQSWQILTGSAVFGHVNLVFINPAGQSTISNITSTSAISISVSPNTHYTYYLTPYTKGEVATSNSTTVDFWTPPSKPTISSNSGSTSALADTVGSPVSFTFADSSKYDYVYAYMSDGSRIGDTQYTNSGFSLPTTAVKTTSFYIVPYDHGTGTVNTAYRSDTYTFTVKDGTATGSKGTTTTSSFTINITGSNIASIAGTLSGATIANNYTNSTSGNVVFSNLSANTPYTYSILVTFKSDNTTTLSDSVRTLSNISYSNLTATSTDNSITVSIDVLNSTVSGYTQSGNTWTKTYSETANTSHTYSTTILNYTGTTPSITYYTKPTISLSWANNTDIVKDVFTFTFTSSDYTSDGTATLIVSGSYTSYKLYKNSGLYIADHTDGIYTASSVSITLSANITINDNYYAIAIDQNTNQYIVQSSTVTLKTTAYTAPSATTITVTNFSLSSNSDGFSIDYSSSSNCYVYFRADRYNSGGLIYGSQRYIGRYVATTSSANITPTTDSYSNAFPPGTYYLNWYECDTQNNIIKGAVTTTSNNSVTIPTASTTTTTDPTALITSIVKSSNQFVNITYKLPPSHEILWVDIYDGNNTQTFNGQLSSPGGNGLYGYSGSGVYFFKGTCTVYCYITDDVNLTLLTTKQLWGTFS